MAFIRRHKFLSFLGSIVILIVIAGTASCGSQPTPNSTSGPATPASTNVAGPVASTPVATTTNPAPPSTAAPVFSAPAAASPASAPASAASVPASPLSAPSTPSSPSLTTAQQQAVEAAQNYLALGQGFSYAGLLQQLTSSSGSGFATSDAKFAINYLNPNWDQQAVEAARGYLALGQGFSYAGLLQQLTSSSGSGFTQAQAEYAINDLNPNWDQQAVEAAKGYLKLGGFSQASLVQQLTSPDGGGFTQAQAEYAVNQVGL